MKSPQKPSSHTFIAFILDRSGSMEPLREAAIAGFNQFLRDQQNAPGEARLTLVQFDDQYEVPADNLPISEMVELDATTFVPRGSTALLDAIGRTIDETQARIAQLPEAQRPSPVIFAIFTDGQENSSLKFTWKDIAQRIQDRREKDGWEFLFLAANQDAVATAAQMNIERHNTSSVAYSAAGMGSSTRSISRRTTGYRTSAEMKKAGLNAPLPDDVVKPLEDIVREEEQKGDEGAA